jgi:hypothetical protein
MDFKKEARECRSYQTKVYVVAAIYLLVIPSPLSHVH